MPQFARYYHLLGPQSEVVGYVVLRAGLSLAEATPKTQTPSPVFGGPDDDVRGRNSTAVVDLPLPFPVDETTEGLDPSDRPADGATLTHGVYAHPPLPPLPGDTRKVARAKRHVKPPTGGTSLPLYFWMGTVTKVWQQHYPTTSPPKGTVGHLKALMSGPSPLTEEQLGQRLDAYLTKVGPEYINLARFATTHTAYAPKDSRVGVSVSDLDAYENAMLGTP